jgi:hypothetical protein
MNDLEFDEFIRQIENYAYPSWRAPRDLYKQLTNRQRTLFIKAALEFIINVRYCNRNNIEEWISHKEHWDSFLKGPE